MVIHLKSNIFLPGLEGRESVELDGAVSVRQFLEEISGMSGQQNIRYVRQGGSGLEDDWEVLINGVQFEDVGGLDSGLKDGDTVVVNMVIVGGG